jgi:Fe-S oxidoreductase
VDTFNRVFWPGQEVFIIQAFLPIIAGFLVLLVGLVALAVWSFWRQHYRLWHLGKDEDCSGQWPTRLMTVLGVAFAHIRTWREAYPGTMHFLIFWGTVFIFLGKIVRLFAYPVGLSTPPQTVFLYASFLSEIGGVVVFVGGSMAVVRRYILKPSRLDTKLENNLIFVWGFMLLLTGYFIKGFRMAAVGPAIPPNWLSWAPVSYWIARFFLILPSRPLNELLVWHRALIHAIPATIFFAYVIVSRSPLKHIFFSSLNVFYRSLKPRGALPPIPDFEEAETFGVREISEFTWKQLLDLEACTRCGRCQDQCPAHLTDKPLSPKKVIQDLKNHLYEKGRGSQTQAPNGNNGSPSLIGEVIQEDTLWACTFCLNCYEQCPVFISAFDKIIDMRRHLVLVETRFPSELRQVFRNLQNRSNPWGEEKRLRADWAKTLGVKTLAEDPEVDLLYWPGCFKGFADRTKKVAISMTNILHKAGVKFGILGPEEGCCGDPARRIGNEYLYKLLVDANIAVLNRYRVKKILTTCPHCFNTLKHEYPQFGGNYEVIHQTEFLTQLLKQKKLTVKEGKPLTVTYHDPCYLGRSNQIYDPPRQVLMSVPGIQLKEMQLSRYRSFCCGGGGGRMWMEEHAGKRINALRIEQALETRPDVIATACPYCLTMLEDALKDKGIEGSVKIKDIAELLEPSLAD